MVIASGENWPDAMSVAPLAATRAWPILLVSQYRMPFATSKALEDLEASSSLIVGGEATVDWVVEQYCPSPSRIRGADRYEVSANVASYATTQGLSFERLAVASGTKYADALAAGPLMGRARGPILLVHDDAVGAPAAAVLAAEATRVLDAYILGGEVTLAPSVANGMALLLQVRPAGP